MHVLIRTPSNNNETRRVGPLGPRLKYRYAYCVICFVVNRWAELLPVEMDRAVIDRVFVILRNELREQKLYTWDGNEDDVESLWVLEERTTEPWFGF